MENNTEPNTLYDSTYSPPSTNNNSITFEQDYFNDNLFDDESIKTNSFAKLINGQEKDKKKQQTKLNNNSNFKYKKYNEYFELEKKVLKSPFYITCKNCGSFIKIKFDNYDYLTAKCKCKLKKNISPYKFISDFCFNQNNIDEKRLNYIKYCIECKRNLTRENLKEKAEPYNENNNITAHQTHHLIDLFNIKKDIKII